MSVQVTATGPSHACLFCNTSDRAYGPVFETQYDAEDFLEWMDKEGLDDSRSYKIDQLEAYKREWEAARDGDLSDTARFGAGSA